jgi:hypothetical protein
MVVNPKLVFVLLMLKVLKTPIPPKKRVMTLVRKFQELSDTLLSIPMDYLTLLA